LAEGKYDTGIPLAEEAYLLAQQAGGITGIIDALSVRIALLDKIEAYSDAYQLQSELITFKDSLFKSDNELQATRMANQHAIRIMEREAEHRADVERITTRISLALKWSLGALILAALALALHALRTVTIPSFLLDSTIAMFWLMIFICANMLLVIFFPEELTRSAFQWFMIVPIESLLFVFMYVAFKDRYLKRFE
jgi:hypothetical protein